MIWIILFLKIQLRVEKNEISDKSFQAFYPQKMERRNEAKPISNIQERIKRQKLKIRNEVNQQRDNIKPDTFGLDDIFNKHDIIILNTDELRDELSNQ